LLLHLIELYFEEKVRNYHLVVQYEPSSSSYVEIN
jgi:hypothetical protein